MEVVVTIIIIGIALPSLFILMGNMSYLSIQNRVMTKAVNYSNNRMEQLVAFKSTNSDWYDSIEDFDGTETLDNGYQRITELTHHGDWEGSGFEAYEINVNVNHPQLPNGYNMSFFLTYYSN